VVNECGGSRTFRAANGDLSISEAVKIVVVRTKVQVSFTIVRNSVALTAR